MRKSKYSYTVEQLKEAILNSKSYAQCLRYLGLNIFGSAYDSLKRNIKANNLNVSHFTGHAWSKGMTGLRSPMLFALNDIILENKHPQYNTFKLKNRLLKEKIFEHKCSSCKLETWLDKIIPIELDHIDGDKQNHHISNLRMLCPNCHAMTSTHAGKNIKR
ncbi:MAG: hypothetical protein JWP44_5038 [Mucilaginibacter sp.]|nr:hypothetical protein [Mucilaginibacter sp.]